MQMNMVMWAVDRFKRYGQGKLCFGSIIGMDETKIMPISENSAVSRSQKISLIIKKVLENFLIL